MAGKNGLTAEERENLTDEEIAGLEDDEFVDEGEPVELAEGETTETDDAVAEADAAGKAAAAKEAEESGTGSAEEKADKEDEEEVSDGPTETALKAVAGAAAEREAKTAAEKKPGTEAAAEEDAGGDDGPRVPNWQVPADLKEKQAAIATQKDAIQAKFDEGEIDASDFRKELEALTAQERELDRVITKAEIGSEMRLDSDVNVTVPAFMEEFPAYAKAGTTLNEALDARVRKLQETTFAENPLSPKVLRAAHEAIVAEFAEAGITFDGGKKGGPTPAPKNGKKVVAKNGQVEPPPTLRNVPAASVENVGENEFAKLDKLADTDPDAYQNALDKLERTNPDAFARYYAQ